MQLFQLVLCLTATDCSKKEEFNSASCAMTVPTQFDLNSCRVNLNLQ